MLVLILMEMTLVDIMMTYILAEWLEKIAQNVIKILKSIIQIW